MGARPGFKSGSSPVYIQTPVYSLSLTKCSCMFVCVHVVQVRTLARTDEARGLLWLMEEEAMQPGGSEETLLERLFSYYSLVDGETKGQNTIHLSHAQTQTYHYFCTFMYAKFMQPHVLDSSLRPCLVAEEREGTSLPVGSQPWD